MPASEQCVQFTWMPKGAGRGGQFSNTTPSESDTDTLVRVRNFIVDGGKWVRVPASEPYYTGVSALPGAPLNLTIYNRYEVVVGAATSQVIADLYNVGPPLVHGVYHVGTAAYSQIWGPLGTLPDGSALPTMLEQVKNRLYMTSGTGLGYIGTMSFTNANVNAGWVSGAQFTPEMVGMVVATDYGYYRIATVFTPTALAFTSFFTGPTGTGNSYIGWDTPRIWDGTNLYTWGFPAPATSLTYLIAGPAAGQSGITGTASTDAASHITWNTGTKFIGLSPDQYITIFDGTPYGSRYRILTVDSDTQLTVSPNPGAVAGPFPFQAASGSAIGVVNAAVGSPNLTWVSGDYFGVSAGDATLVAGSTIYIEGIRYVVASVTSPIALVLTTNVSALSGGVGPPAPYAYQGNYGPLVWETPGIRSVRSYQYGYFYYAPSTGHASNMGPLLLVNDGPPNNDGVTTVISGIITNDDAIYTQIILCRTALNGSTLFPLAVLPNTGGPLTYVDSIKDDTKLGTVGPGFLPAPVYTNGPPPNDMYLIAYWDGRFWYSSRSDPGTLGFTGRSDEIPLGVAEECFPNTLSYFRTLPESDGAIRGLRNVGRDLCVIADRAIYRVIGDVPTNYTLSKVSSKGHGSSHFACNVIPSEDSSAGDVLVHFGNDHRLYWLFGEGNDLPYSYKIQDELNTTPVLRTYVHIYNDQRSTFVIFAPSDVTKNFWYDLDRKVWLNVHQTIFGFTQGLLFDSSTGLTPTFTTLVGGTTNVLKLLSSSSAAIGEGLIRTQYVSPPGTAEDDEKTLQAVVVKYAATADPTNLLVVTVFLDENPSNSVVLTRMDPLADPRLPVYVAAPDDRIYIPQNRVCSGRTFSIQVHALSGSLGGDIESIRAFWSYHSEEGAKAGVI